jgi:membrane-associated phospholipid phosphatase
MTHTGALLRGTRTLTGGLHVVSPRRPRPRPRWWSELLLVLGIYAAYDVTRDLRHTSTTVADHHARLILRWERDAHLAIEHPLNHALDHLPVLAVLAAYFYATLHFIITPAVLVGLYRAHPDVYRSARTWLATATVSALVGFWLFPVTPPRLLPGSGIHDTLADVHQWGWWSGQTSTPSGTGNLVNEFAAMPSLHVAWALWSGWLIARYAQRGWVRVLGAAYPMLTALVVLSTGNHYLADVLAGAALIVITAATTTSRPRLGRDTPTKSDDPLRGASPARKWVPIRTANQSRRFAAVLQGTESVDRRRDSP